MLDHSPAVSHRNASVVIASLLIFVVAALTYIVLGGKAPAFLGGKAPALLLALLIALPWFLVVLTADSRRMRLGLVPIGIPVLVLALPFVSVVLPGAGSTSLFQAGSVCLAGFYLLVIGPVARRQALLRARPAVLPLALMFGLFGLSYALSPGVTRDDWLYVFQLLSACAYVVLGSVLCDSVPRVKSGIFMLIGAGALQLPVVLLQMTGIADRLPARLELSASQYLGRYPGSFHDYELLAEFCAMCFLACLGLIVFRLHPPRRSVIFALAGCVLVVGWLTMTRALLFGVVGGSVLLVVFALLQSGARFARLWRLLGVIALMGILVTAFVPSSVSSSYLQRFTQSDVSLSGNAFNRGELYATGWSLVDEMPPQGYGANMITVFDRAWGGSLGIAELTSPHSLYMTTLLTAGFPGLIALAWLAVAVLAMSFSCALRRRGASADVRALGAILATVLVVWVVTEVKIDFVRHSFYVDLLAFLFGIVSSLFWLSRESAPSHQSIVSTPGSSSLGTPEAGS
jgi:O-antigen ligase